MSTREPLTRAVLDSMGCGHPSHVGSEPCSELYLHAACHPSAGTRARYDKATGVLSIACRRCSAPVAALKVAER